MSEYIREDKATIAKSLIDLIGVCSKYERGRNARVIHLGDIYLQCHFEFKEVGQKKKTAMQTGSGICRMKNWQRSCASWPIMMKDATAVLQVITAMWGMWDLKIGFEKRLNDEQNRGMIKNGISTGKNETAGNRMKR